MFLFFFIQSTPKAHYTLQSKRNKNLHSCILITSYLNLVQSCSPAEFLLFKVDEFFLSFLRPFDGYPIFIDNFTACSMNLNFHLFTNVIKHIYKAIVYKSCSQLSLILQYSKALKCTFFGSRKNLSSSKFVQLELLKIG